jgi:hypothetical protein
MRTVDPNPNPYAVEAEQTPKGWEVRIVDPAGGTVFSRACGDESEARTFASTVRQHISWLSPQQFRRYYRLESDV